VLSSSRENRRAKALSEVALPYRISSHVSVIICFKDACYQGTAMDLRALKQVEVHSGMFKIAETGTTDTNIGVETLMSTVTDFVVWQVRAAQLQSLYYSLENTHSQIHGSNRNRNSDPSQFCF
jgi:hypothetical protein